MGYTSFVSGSGWKSSVGHAVFLKRRAIFITGRKNIVGYTIFVSGSTSIRMLHARGRQMRLGGLFEQL